MYLRFAFRYFKAKKSTNAINIISIVSMVAMAFGTAALIIVMSAFNGFEDLVKTLYSGFYTDLKVMPVKGKTIFLSEEQLKLIKTLPYVQNASLVAEDKAAMMNNDVQSIIIIKGVDENYTNVAGVSGFIEKGKFDLGSEEIPFAILGSGVASMLSVNVSELPSQLSLYVPKKIDGNVFLPEDAVNIGTIYPSGIFTIQQDFDTKYVITNIKYLKSKMKWAANEYSGLEIKLNNVNESEKAKATIQKIVGKSMIVMNRYEQNQTLYRVMSLEKWYIFVIMSVILLIAAFNIVGSLTMLVLEKQKDIQVLQALGANRSFIKRIFLSEGILLAWVGALIGIAIALILIYLHKKFHLIPIEGESFIINYYPVKILVSDLFIVFVTIFLISFLASWIPASKAATKKFELKS